MNNFSFKASVIQPAYSCEQPPRVQTGWVLQVDEYIEGNSSSYPVGERITWALGHFSHKPMRGSQLGEYPQVIVNFTNGKFAILPPD